MSQKNEEIKGERTMTMAELEEMLDENKNNQDESNIPWFEQNNNTNMENKENNSSLREQVENFKKNTPKNNDLLYSFKIEEIIELEKYLKSKIFGQDEIIDQYINHFMLNTYRNENNDKNLGIFFNFGPSGTGKNYIMELIADKLDFGVFLIDLSQYHYVEISTLLGATDGYTSDNNSILETIADISKDKNGKMILIFDEIEKGIDSINGNINTFFTGIMNIINSNTVYTKNNNQKIDLSNFIFVFNSNLGFDNYKQEERENNNKIGFNTGESYQKKKEKPKIDEKYIEKLMKNNMKINISVFNRLKKGNNFFFFNPLKQELFDDYLIKKFDELQEELKQNFGTKKIPQLSYFNEKINKFDYTKGFRGINDLIFIEFKLYIMKNVIFKNYFNTNKKSLLIK